MKRRDLFVRVGVPAAVFVVVWTIHYLWLGFFPERDPAQSQWVQVAASSGAWWSRYVHSQSYWLGFSYALSLAFATHALQYYRRNRSCTGRRLAVGSITLTGFFAVAGCFLLGCCGSPMLAVYLSLFGAAVIPLAKPLVAVLTSCSIVAAWIYMHFHHPRSSKACCAPDAHGLGAQNTDGVASSGQTNTCPQR